MLRLGHGKGNNYLSACESSIDSVLLVVGWQAAIDAERDCQSNHELTDAAGKQRQPAVQLELLDPVDDAQRVGSNWNGPDADGQQSMDDEQGNGQSDQQPHAEQPFEAVAEPPGQDMHPKTCRQADHREHQPILDEDLPLGQPRFENESRQCLDADWNERDASRNNGDSGGGEHGQRGQDLAHSLLLFDRTSETCNDETRARQTQPSYQA